MRFCTHICVFCYCNKMMGIGINRLIFSLDWNFRMPLYCWIILFRLSTCEIESQECMVIFLISHFLIILWFFSTGAECWWNRESLWRRWLLYFVLNLKWNELIAWRDLLGQFRVLNSPLGRRRGWGLGGGGGLVELAELKARWEGRRKTSSPIYFYLF